MNTGNENDYIYIDNYRWTEFSQNLESLTRTACAHIDRVVAKTFSNVQYIHEESSTNMWEVAVRQDSIWLCFIVCRSKSKTEQKLSAALYPPPEPQEEWADKTWGGYGAGGAFHSAYIRTNERWARKKDGTWTKDSQSQTERSQAFKSLVETCWKGNACVWPCLCIMDMRGSCLRCLGEM